MLETTTSVKEKLLLLTPHLSTGGLPQVLVNKISLLKDVYDILVVEHSNHSWIFNIQRNRIINLIGSKKLITLGEDKKKHFVEVLNSYSPDIIYLEEFPEFFLDDSISKVLYSKERNYKIIETTHDSSFPVHSKKYFPDKFIFVSPYNAFRYSMYDIPYDIVEYPVDFKKRDQNFYKKKLKFEKDWIHVVNVGLFTPRKNQSYIFDIARKLTGYKIKFHFLGNQADNFRDYWQPLLENKPDNCVIWGERDDVYDFLQASDVFFFASKGDKNNKELNPIAIKEALEYRIPMLMFNLDVYCGKYDIYDNVNYLTGNLDEDYKKLLKICNMKDLQNLFTLDYDKHENKIFINYHGNDIVKYKISIKCMSSGAPIYWFDFESNGPVQWFVIPIPSHVLKFYQRPNFRGFMIEFYEDNNLCYTDTIVVNDILPNLTPLNFEPFDCSYRNYIEFFSDDIYGGFNINDLDVVVDVGANIGLFAKYMYSKGAKNVILIEANPLLEKNIKNMLDEDYEKSKIYMSPLHRTKEKIKFNYSTKNSTIGSTVFDNTLVSYDELDTTIELESITLSEIFSDNNIEKISLFKMDIEGGEYDVIDSLTDEHMNRIERFMIEFHANTGQLVPLVEKLESYGFECEFYKLEMVKKYKVDINEYHGVLITKPKK